MPFDVACLEGSKDPFCHLLSWEYQLITVHNQRERAENLHQCVKKLEKIYSSNNKTLNGILFLLLELRKVPAGDDSTMVRSKSKMCRCFLAFFSFSIGWKCS